MKKKNRTFMLYPDTIEILKKYSELEKCSINDMLEKCVLSYKVKPVYEIIKPVIKYKYGDVVK